MPIIHRAIPLSRSGETKNYNVIASLIEPASPAENTIWINTETPMPENGWGFGLENPFDNPITGNIWIKTTNFATIVFSTSATISEPQNIDSVFNYNGTAWKSTTAEIYQKGTWYKIYSDTRHLLSNKTEFEQWSVTAISGIATILEFNEDSIPPEMMIVTQGAGTSSANTRLDLTDYKTLSYEYLFPTSAGGLYAGIGTSAQSPNPAIAHTRSSSWQSKTIDITNYTGEYYIVFKLTTTASSPNFGLRDMTLTK